MKNFKLIHNLKYDLTRSVNDMTALFAYCPADESDNLLYINCDENFYTANFKSDGKAWQSKAFAAAEDTSGEALRCVKLALLDVFTQVTGVKPDLPWGILTGVRPGKLAHKLVDGGMAFKDLPIYLQQKYLLPDEQGRLLTKICALQKKIVPDKNNEAGIYIGIPFCPSKCNYCSFPSGIIPEDEESQQNFLNFIEQDVENVVKLLSMHSLNITSVYIGGGTPTSFNENVFARLMRIVHKKLLLPTVREFTVEAGRPDCFSSGKLAAMEAAGVNRISVNPQTFHDKTLKLIGRSHSVKDFYDAYEMAVKSSIPVINTDLIIGLPGESIEDVRYSFAKVKELKPQNLTVHTLTLKKGAALFGAGHSMEPDAAAKMVLEGAETASEMNMHPYYLYRQHYMLGHLANIGYAVEGAESVYNVQMMEERHTVIGIGPSAATKVPQKDGHHLRKLNMPKNIFTYISNLQQFAQKRSELFTEQEE